MSSSSSESSDSESSQFSYRSGGSADDMCLLNRSYTSSDSDSSHPDHVFTQEDRDKIVASGRHLSADCGTVFPEKLDISPLFVKLRAMPWSISIVSGSLKHLLRLKEVRSKPTSVEWDVCVFSDRNPLMILTFSSTNDRKTTLYNSSLAREIMLRLNSDMKSYLTCTHGVLVNKDLSSDEIFRTRISNFREEHKIFSVPISLQMSAERCSSMLKHFMDMQRSASRSNSFSSDEKEEFFALTSEEKNEILRFPNICQGPAQIFPMKTWTHLKHLFPKECQNVEKVIGERHRLLIVQLPNSNLLESEEREDKKSKEIPKLLFDIIAIDFENPMTVLTFAEETNRDVDDHNYDIASHILKTIKKDVEMFSCIKGVIEIIDAQNQTELKSRVSKAENREHLFGEKTKFVMNVRKCKRVVRSLCQLMPALKDFTSNEFTRLVDEKKSFPVSIRNDPGSAELEDPSWSLIDRLPCNIRLVIIGKEGVGKTSTCNTILGEEIFTYEDQSEIPRVESSKVKPYNRDMVVCDTKGCGQDFTPVVNGVTDVDAVVVVVRRDAIDEEDHKIYTNLKEEFGEDVLDYTLVVTTEGGKLQDDCEPVKISNPDLVNLVKEFRNGWVNFDNKASREEKKEMVKNFMFLLSDLVQANNGNRFYRSIL